MINQSTTLLDISKEKTLRCDVNYIKLHTAHSDNFLTFNDLFTVALPESCTENELSEDFFYCEIGNSDKNGDISPVTLNFENRSLEDEKYYKKIENGDITHVDLDDILISKVRPNLKKYIRITADKKNVCFTTAFIRLKAKEMPSVLYYCLRSVFYEDLMSIARQGKGYPTINEKDLITMRFNEGIINKLRENFVKINTVIEYVEKTIARKSTSIITLQSIIDSAFQSEFGFDYKKFEELKSCRHYTSKQALFSNNPDLRFSAKFHRPAGAFVLEQLTRLTDKKIKHYISEPIILGASISPADFDETGQAYYVSMETIKTLKIVLDVSQLISDTYYESKKTKSLKPGDIIMARSGVAIGKTAIVTEDFKGVFSDFTMRIRFDERKYNPQFAYYYLRCTYFQYLIEVYKKGLQNDNIFPIVIQEFPIPDITVSEQNRIVDDIEKEIKKQNDIRGEIEALRRKIDDIIIQSISV